ncbi:MAG: laccase domain-containing protein, partial [Oscillibacter sp.]|nr:laccase domain-containing protein [Oscillibacter sp.]
MLQNEQNGLVYFTSPLLGAPHGFSTRLGGVSEAPCDSLDLSPHHLTDFPAGMENFRRFYGAIGAKSEKAVLSHQVHETTVRAVTAADAG